MRFFDAVTRWCFYIGAFLIGAMAVTITYDVIMRYALSRPNIWAMQSSEYIAIYSTFLAAAWILRNEGHVTIDLVTSRLTPRTQAVLNIITSIIGVCVCAILLWQSSKELVNSFQKGIATNYYPWVVTEWPTFAAVPFGSLLLSIQFVRRTYHSVIAFSKQRVPPAAQESLSAGKQLQPVESGTDCPDSTDKKPAQ